MCDTILAPPGSTAERIMLFGKNSDRQRNEAQTVEYFPRAYHPVGAKLNCTYIAVPQVQHTRAVLLCRPFWIWGAEMGVNEYGVVIGNEGLHARSPAPEEKALTGMDLLRLALERASTAAEAVEVMTTLLENYGQGGNCGHLTPSYYNNGFMVADPKEAFVLETVGREWLVESVRGVRAISNGYSIENAVQRVSKGLLALIHDSGWSEQLEPSYAEMIGNPHREHIGNADRRRASSTSLLNSRHGQLTALEMMSILRDHGFGNCAQSRWSSDCTFTRTICMHAGEDDRPGQTVGSMVSELYIGGGAHWVTGTAAPCISVFKPVLMDVPLPLHGPLPTDRFDSRTLWWQHERFHRAALQGDFARILDGIRPERDALEADFHARVKAVHSGGSVAERSQVVEECWNEAMEMEQRWYTQIDINFWPEGTSYISAWERMNRLAGVSPF